MSKPLVVSIPHNLGRAEATQRLRKGLGEARQKFGSVVGFVDETWTGDHLDFKVAAMGQTIGGRLDVADEAVRLEVDLPWILSVFAEKAKAMIQKQGTLMLEKK
jgi:hypothetical protein